MQDPEHGERGMSQNQATRSSSGSWRNELCCEIVDGGGGNEPDPQETRSGESHAMSRCEQPGRGSTHHSTREAAFCVVGTRGDDESDVKHTHRGSS